MNSRLSVRVRFLQITSALGAASLSGDLEKKIVIHYSNVMHVIVEKEPNVWKENGARRKKDEKQNLGDWRKKSKCI